MRKTMFYPLVAAVIASGLVLSACDKKEPKKPTGSSKPTVELAAYKYDFVPPAVITSSKTVHAKSPVQPLEITYNTSFPTKGPLINQWVEKEYPGNSVSRSHAWSIWGALTTLTSYDIEASTAQLGSSYLPTFMTWYSSYEVYGVNSDAKNSCSATMEPTTGTNGIKRCYDGSLLDFNKFSLVEAKYVIDKKFNDLTTLKNRPKTPLDLPPFNSSNFTENTNINVSFSLKPVYYLLKNNAYNLLPYWGGLQSGTTTEPAKPVPTTWNQCVQITVGTPDSTEAPPTVCNPGKGNAKAPAGGWPTATLSQFLAVPLTQSMIDQLTYAQKPNTPIQPSSIMETSIGYSDDAKPEVGDVAVLVGMHVTVRETQDWVWQTMYWSPKDLNVSESTLMNTDAPVFPPQTYDYVAGPNYPGSSYDNPYGSGSNTPGSVPTWAQNYAMCTANSPVYPVQPRTGGSNADTYPQICYNPWLETGFEGIHGHFSESGLNSNCMTCHSQASYQGAISPPTVKCTQPQGFGYYVNGYVSRDNTCLTNQNYAYDFSWHISNAYKEPQEPSSNEAVIHQKPPTVAPSFSK
jgi:hypothetical protein